MNGRKNLNFPPKVLYENRYCNQNDFSVLVYGVVDQNNKLVKSFFKLQGPYFECEKYTNMSGTLYAGKAAVINSDLFGFGGYLQNGEYDNCARKFCKTKTKD